MTASVNGSVANETTDVKCSSEDNIARPNTALLSLILTLTTFLLALALKEFRNSHFLGRNVSALCAVCKHEFVSSNTLKGELLYALLLSPAVCCVLHIQSGAEKIGHHAV